MNHSAATRGPAVLHGGPLPALPVRHLGEALLRAAKSRTAGEIVCLGSAAGTRTLSYPRLLHDAARLLGAARARGARPGDRVVLQLVDERDLLTAFWACQLGALVPVPVTATPPPGSPLSAAGLLAGACEVADRPWTLTSTAPTGPDRSRWLGGVAALRAGDPAVDFAAPAPHDVAALLLTSGSTGVPKAVMLTHHNILSRAHASAGVRGLTRRSRTFNWMPLDHVGGLIMFHVRDVLLGCHQVHARTRWVLEDPLRWLDVLSDHRCDTTWAPNFAYGLVTDEAARVAARDWDLSGLRYLMNGGEPVRPAVARRFLALLAPFGLPATAMHPGWGMSETSSGVVDCVFTPHDHDEGERFVPVGRPHPGVSVRIVAEDGKPLMAGETGRLQVSGAPVTPGYYRAPQQNQRSFTDGGWFTTGDLGYVQDGLLTVTGRADDLLEMGDEVRHGHEVEAAVEELPFVEPSFTVAYSDPAQDRRPGSLVIAFHHRAGVSNDRDNWRIVEHVAQRFGIVVSRVAPVAKEAVAKTGIGKIKRAQLARRLTTPREDPPPTHLGPPPPGHSSPGPVAADRCRATEGEHAMSEELRVLQAVRIKGRPTAPEIAAASAVAGTALERVLRTSADAGLCTAAHGRHTLTPAGREHLRRLVAQERAGLDRAALARAYEDFGTHNTALKRLITDWQLVGGTTVNDHSDAAYDADVIGRLAHLHEEFSGPLARLVLLAPRLAHYPGRLARALARIQAGDHSWLARPLVDSYHTVWFELHEDLLALTGRERAREAAAGRAE
ncbi:AMP-binding protein [Streptomyces sp. PU-14G]|uniref:AMP-binding protein n=1 Tax=Streptomyces sp. PU-14G TaxID=2800808 RepID=UPI0034DF08CE